MSINPYATPTAAVADVPLEQSKGDVRPFFAVSLTKLFVLSTLTLGLYEIYWFYQNWTRIKEREGSNIVPVLRAVFSIFFCYSCFTLIRDRGAKVKAGSLAAGPLAAGWILATLTWRLPDPYSWLTMVAIVFMLPVQALANRINAIEAPSHHPNGEFSAANWVVMVIGGIVLVLAFVGTFLPQE